MLPLARSTAGAPCPVAAGKGNCTGGVTRPTRQRVAYSGASTSAFCWAIAPAIESGAVVPAVGQGRGPKAIPARAISMIASTSWSGMVSGLTEARRANEHVPAQATPLGGTVLLAAGHPGRRYALPNSLIHIHQPLGGFRGHRYNHDWDFCLRAAALTARGEAEDGVRAVAAGYDAQLDKPVEPVMLLATVARLAQPAGM